ncbi:MAG: hypothetical protein ACWA5U_00330 [bacterium]
MEEGKNTIPETLLRWVKSLIIAGLGTYASILTIMSYNDDISNLFNVHKQVDNLEERILEQIDSSEKKILTSLSSNNNLVTKHLVEIEDAQNGVKELVKKVDNESTKAHSRIWDKEGFISVKIRRANLEQNHKDKNSIYYDANSKHFPSLQAGQYIHDCYVILKNPSNHFLPVYASRIRGRTNPKHKGSNRTDITFQVSKSIFEALGGNEDSEYLEVNATIVDSL